MDQQWRIDVPAHGPTRVSVPLAGGSDDAFCFHVAGPEGRRVEAQARPIVTWPDGSPRWVQLDFHAASAGAHVVRQGGGGDRPAMPVVVTRDETHIEVAVGRMRVSLSPHQPMPIERVSFADRVLTSDVLPFAFTVTRADGGTCPLAASEIDHFAIEADGPSRYQIMWESEHADDAQQRVLDVRFRMEFLAGIEGFSLSYQFLHRLPGCERLDLKHMDATFTFAAMVDDAGRGVVAQRAHTDMWLRRFVRTTEPVTMRLDRSQFDAHVDDAAVLGDEAVYPWFLRGGNRIVEPAVAIEDAHAAVVCAMHDFRQQRPKTLTVSPGHIHFGIWPEDAGALSLPQGRSCRQVFGFRFCDAGDDLIEAALAKPERCYVQPSHALLDKADSRRAGGTWDQPRLFDGGEPGAAFFSSVLAQGVARWRTVAEMFHHGDTPDPGYTMTYAATGRAPHDKAMTLNTGGAPHGHFHQPNDFPPVWSNNEYDAIYCLALEAMRTGDAGAFEKMCAAARHQIEVDFVHHADHWMHDRTTPPHSYDHVTTTAALASHQWTQGLYYYYVLTGDDDVPEVVRAICDFDIAFLDRPELKSLNYFHRELGWAIVALVFGYELTAEHRYIEAARELIMRADSAADRTDFGEYEKAHGSSRGMNASSLGIGFNVNTVALGLKCYHQATAEPWAGELLTQWTAIGMRNFNDRTTGVKLTELFPETFCYVCELTGDDTYLRESLWQLVMFFRGFGALGWIPADGSPLSTKALCRIYRGLLHYLSALGSAGLLDEAQRRVLGD